MNCSSSNQRESEHVHTSWFWSFSSNCFGRFYLIDKLALTIIFLMTIQTLYYETKFYMLSTVKSSWRCCCCCSSHHLVSREHLWTTCSTTSTGVSSNSVQHTHVHTSSYLQIIARFKGCQYFKIVNHIWSWQNHTMNNWVIWGLKNFTEEISFLTYVPVLNVT